MARPPVRPPPPRRRLAGPALPPRQTIIAAAVAGVVVCALLAGLVGSALLDRSAPPAPTFAPSLPEQAGMGAYETSMRTAIAQNPDDAVALSSLANLLVLQGDVPGAIDLYERALAADPDNAATRRAFALALAQGGNLADAELQYRRVLDADPNDGEALVFLGQLYERWSPPRSADAAAAYRGAIAVAPGSVSADEAAKALARLPADITAASPVATPR